MSINNIIMMYVKKSNPQLEYSPLAIIVEFVIMHSISLMINS